MASETMISIDTFPAADLNPGEGAEVYCSDPRFRATLHRFSDTTQISLEVSRVDAGQFTAGEIRYIEVP